MGKGNANKPKRRTRVGYSKSIMQEICRRIADGETLKRICAEDKERFPDRKTIQAWLLARKYPELNDMYAQARELQRYSMGDDSLDIADDARFDWIERKNKKTGASEYLIDHEHVQRSRLRCETRLKLLLSMEARKNNAAPPDAGAGSALKEFTLTIKSDNWEQKFQERLQERKGKKSNG